MEFEERMKDPKSMWYHVDPPVIIPCTKCGASIETNMPNIKGMCNTCLQAANEKEESEKAVIELKRRQNAWAKMCPALMQKTDVQKLPRPALLQKVMEWKYGPKGLILYGITGLGKTRCSYLLLQREFIENKREVKVMDGFICGIKLAGLFGESASEAADYIEESCNCPLLFLDDVFKSKLTEKIEECLFTIIDQRLSRELPIILTLNDVGESLMARLSQDRGPALIRRLRECCDSIAFL